MGYTPEPWDSLALNFTGGPYTLPTDPLALALGFVGGGEPVPPLPWSRPRLTHEYTAPQYRAACAADDAALRFAATVALGQGSALCWHPATGVGIAWRVQYSVAAVRNVSHRTRWQAGTAQYRQQRWRWHRPQPQNQAPSLPWGPGAPVDRGDYTAGWIIPTARDARHRLGWYSVNLRGTVYDDAAAFQAQLNTDTATALTLNTSSGPMPVENPLALQLRFGYVPASRPSVPHDVSARLSAHQATPRDTRRALPWGPGQSLWHDYDIAYPAGPDPIAPEPPAAPTVKTVYVIMNTLDIVDVATETPLHIENVAIGLDIDSISWSFSGTIYGAGTLARVAPDEHGMRDIAVTLNGHRWVFAIKRYSSDEQFPTEKFSLTGISRTQYMGQPFAPARTYSNPTGTTAAQAAQAELQNTGFSLTWPTGGAQHLPDWLLPAGTLSYRDQTPAQVVGKIVSAAGGIMVPNTDSDGWTVQPRYRVPPWDWDTATPDAIIYIGMVRSRAAQYDPAPAFNACYVSGVSQGVAVDVQRQGSGGTQPMPDVHDDLITDPQPAISRGTAELAGSGNKVVEDLSVIIPENGAAPGVLIPGQLAKVSHDDSQLDYMGLVLSTSIAVKRAGGAEIYQTITLERRA